MAVRKADTAAAPILELNTTTPRLSAASGLSFTARHQKPHFESSSHQVTNQATQTSPSAKEKYGSVLRANWNLSQLSPLRGIVMPSAAPAHSQFWINSSAISVMTMVAMAK